MDLTGIPAIDTHCHPFPPQQDTITAQHLRDSLSVSLRGKTPVENESMLLCRMTVKALSVLLDCPPTWEATMAARNERVVADKAGYHTTLFEDANIGMLMIDPGYPATQEITVEEFSEVMPCPIVEGYRTERFAASEEQAFAKDQFGSFTDFVDAFNDKLDDEASRSSTRFFKTVIAYRTGLAIQRVGQPEARAAWDAHEHVGDSNEKVLRDFLFWETTKKAKEHDLPFQVHTGHTSHVNPWPNVNPILMTPMLNEPEMQDVRFVLVHGGYPYCTEAGYMTSVYPNVALDLSLMIPWSSIGIARRIEETLESAPTSKIMYGSDGIQTPELYWISAKNTRRALGRVLDRLEEEGVVDTDEATEIGKDILYRNAERIYGVSL